MVWDKNLHGVTKGYTYGARVYLGKDKDTCDWYNDCYSCNCGRTYNSDSKCRA